MCVLWIVSIHIRLMHPDEFEEVNQLYIDPEECIDCSVCEPECPVEAIFIEDEVPEAWEDYIEINAAYFE